MNILHILTDQQRFDTIAARGNPYIKTPNLDRLVREGTAFNRAYSPSPECVPARASMITGCYPGRTGCYSNGYEMPSPDAFAPFMQRLSDHGYRTHGIGKCHFTPDAHALMGFQSRDTQEEIPGKPAEDDYLSQLRAAGQDWILEPHGVRGEMYYIPQASPLPPRLHPSHWIADRSVAFIEDRTTDPRPWYLYSSFIHPHPPFAPPIPWHKLYRGPDMPLPEVPENLEDLLCFINRFQNRSKYRDRGGLDLNLVRQLRAYYTACISFVDQQIGRILDALEASGQLENTLILFTSDHGEYLGDFGCFGKRGMHEVSARIPMLVRWPDGAHRGAVSESPCSLVDLAPTFLDAAGIPYETTEFDGVSLRRLIEGTVSRKQVFSQYQCGANALYLAVEADWKYIFSAPDQKEYLFDLKKDPKEHRNLARDPAAGETLLRLRQDCIHWVRTTGQTNAVTADGGWTPHAIRKMPEDPDVGLIFQDPPWWDRKSPLSG